MTRDVVTMVGMALCLGGCSTLVHGPYQRVRLESNPPGATATVAPLESVRGPGYLDEKQTVSTPAVVRLKRDNAYRIEFERSGYSAASSQLEPHYDWFWGQVTCGLCEALGDLPAVDTSNSSTPTKFAVAAFYDYPIRGLFGALGRGLRLFSPDAMLGSTFKLKPKNAGYWEDWHALGEPVVRADLKAR